MKKAFFISFEGIDGAGKSTHLSTVCDYLQEKGHRVLKTREPGGTELAELLREKILHHDVEALTEVLLIFAARRDHLIKVIAPALQEGICVVSDRFTDATFAYQGYGRHFDLDILSQLENWTHAIAQAKDKPYQIQPDWVFWFDIAPELAAQRLAKARAADRFEAESVDFFDRVRSGYAARAQARPDQWVRIQADQTIAQVKADVMQAIQSYIA